MDKALEAHMAEIRRLEEAIEKTTSPYLKTDYSKRVKRMKKDLKAYIHYKKEARIYG